MELLILSGAINELRQIVPDFEKFVVLNFG
ncbi:hypothetical protein ETAA8_45570 [Anatilimnocola aggregata]|uniref:Uncharacterized protein n=1 Tax=Anatilimnocola aggregata TaxID=2528021 RepID=A0A517YGU5_9BACT|nr:hypothetical protein ETAA8_45570 [Anatilimnocola aggregata]